MQTFIAITALYMFSKNEGAGGNQSGAETIIGPSVKVEGDFKAKGNVIVDGVLNGSLQTASDLTVGEKAEIKADVQATNATISGIVHGSVIIHGHLSLTATAKIVGDIQTKSIEVEKGAQINGQLKMAAASESPTSKAKEKN